MFEEDEMSRKLTLKEALARGIIYCAKEFKGGLVHATVTFSGLKACIIRNDGRSVAWLSSRYHKLSTATYFVNGGRVLVATRTLVGNVFYQRLTVGESYQVPTGMAHSVYLPIGSAITVVLNGKETRVHDTFLDNDLDRELEKLDPKFLQQKLGA